jgi:hypothetical protein
MSDLTKINSTHLSRLAYVYLRQSSAAQVEHNRESTARQYALVTKAAELGWPAQQVLVIDEDLGVSGSGIIERSERNWPRLYSYPLTTSRFSISSPVPGSCGRSVMRVAAGLCSPSGAASSARSRGTDRSEPCCSPPRSGKSSSSTSTGAGCHTWCKRMGFVRVVAGDK